VPFNQHETVPGIVNRRLQLDEAWPASPACAPQRLVLTWGAHEVEVTAKHPTLTVGRGGLNDVVIKSDLVSRRHARIELRDVSFSLTDQSGNGTYIADAAGTTRMVRNDRHVLTGTGTISFGINPESSRLHLIRYAVNP
jgi:pSer/pThr/pTyr-binding forkhead associated (FHA) protein